MSGTVSLEIAVQDAAGARAAFAGGADRIELCQALASTGGLTPTGYKIEVGSPCCIRFDPRRT